MRPDEPVGAGATDKEGSCQQPEGPGSRRLAQRGESLAQGIPLVSRRRLDGFATPRRDGHIHGTFTHEQTENPYECERETRQDVSANSPSLMLDQRTEHRQKYELTSGIARSENPHHRAAIFDKPAIGDRCTEG